MDNQTDNDLRDHIRDIFEKFEDPSADKGWLLLREKYHEKKHRAAWPWWASAAAVMLLCFGIVILNNYNQTKPGKVSYKTIKENHRQSMAGNQKQISITDQSAGRKNNRLTTNKKSSYAKHLVLPLPNSNHLPSNQTISGINSSAADQTLPAKTTDSLKIQANNYAGKKDAAVVASRGMAPDPNIVLQKKIVKPVISMFGSEEDKHKVFETSNVTNDDSKKIRFSIYAATYFNYAKGSNDQLNVGAGMAADIKISKNLILSTGVALSQNTLSYASFPTRISNENYLSILPPQNQNAGSANSASLFENYNASLIGLDIPLNLKFEFGPGENAAYISAGLSSGTFINEAYSYYYAVGQQTQNTTINKNFDNFYFARTLNVSFGMGYSLSKTNHLIIEPFLKYPLDGLGAQQIRFGAGGLNLKFNFTTSKK